MATAKYNSITCSIQRNDVCLCMSWPQHAQVTQHLFAGQVCPFAQAGNTRSGRIQHVCVGKYAAPHVFLSDREWCAKNSLHRYRLTLLNFEGQSHEATAPVPADLVLAFSCNSLESKRPVSAEVLDEWSRTNMAPCTSRLGII